MQLLTNTHTTLCIKHNLSSQTNNPQKQNKDEINQNKTTDDTDAQQSSNNSDTDQSLVIITPKCNDPRRRE